MPMKRVDPECVLLIFTCVDEGVCGGDICVPLSEYVKTGDPYCPFCGDHTEFFYTNLIEKDPTDCLTNEARGG